MSVIDEIGNKYMKLLVISREENSREGRARWLCKCDCGKDKVVLGKHLRSGNTKSCGCLQKEKVIQKNLDNGGDLTGEKFGKLLVIESNGFFIRSNKRRSRLWKCECECGNIVDVQHSYLNYGDTTSCGCIRSKGEYEIEQLLKKHNISYEKEVKFKDLFDKDFLRFDFAIYKNNNLYCLIEFNGIQHYNKSNGYYHEDLIIHDQMKKDYCEQNNILLHIIKYKRNYEVQLIDLNLKELING